MEGIRQSQKNNGSASLFSSSWSLMYFPPRSRGSLKTCGSLALCLNQGTQIFANAESLSVQGHHPIAHMDLFPSEVLPLPMCALRTFGPFLTWDKLSFLCECSDPVSSSLVEQAFWKEMPRNKKSADKFCICPCNPRSLNLCPIDILDQIILCCEGLSQ